MFKAAVALVALAFATLAYGWVKAIDPLLYGSIALSAVAGLFVRVVMVRDRRAHPELTRKGRRAALSSQQSAREADRARKSLAELRTELGQLGAEGQRAGTHRRTPLNPFAGLPPDTAAAAEALSTAPPTPRPRPARNGNGDRGDFRSRLSAVLGETEEPAAPVDEEIGNDWIRIDDLPNITRATREGGGYGRPEPQPAGSRRRPRQPSAPSGSGQARPPKAPGRSTSRSARSPSKG